MAVYIAVYRREPHHWRQWSHERQTTITAATQEAAEQEAERQRGVHEVLLAVRSSTPDATTAQRLTAERRSWQRLGGPRP